MATSTRVDWLDFPSPSCRIQMIFPSRSTSKLFDLPKYLSIAFILTGSKEGRSNFCRSLIFGYPSTFFIVVRKKFMSSSVISLEGFCFCLCFLINLFFLDLIKYHYIGYIILKFCITGKARVNEAIVIIGIMKHLM